MQESDINQVVAEALRRHKESGRDPTGGKWTNPRLSEVSGVSQRSLTNILNPSQRTGGKSGKVPGATLAQIQAVANAMGLRFIQLCMTEEDEARLAATPEPAPMPFYLALIAERLEAIQDANARMAVAMQCLQVAHQAAPDSRSGGSGTSLPLDPPTVQPKTKNRSKDE